MRHPLSMRNTNAPPRHRIQPRRYRQVHPEVPGAGRADREADGGDGGVDLEGEGSALAELLERKRDGGGSGRGWKGTDLHHE